MKSYRPNGYPDDWETCGLWDGKISVHFGYPEHGWVLLSLLTTAFNNDFPDSRYLPRRGWPHLRGLCCSVFSNLLQGMETQRHRGHGGKLFAPALLRRTLLRLGGHRIQNQWRSRLKGTCFVEQTTATERWIDSIVKSSVFGRRRLNRADRQRSRTSVLNIWISDYEFVSDLRFRISNLVAATGHV
jgi:hypothetical protein